MAQTTSFEAGMIARSDALVGTLARAADYAAGQGQPSITLEHLLLALTEDDDAAGVLTASSVDLHRLRNEVAGFIGQQSPATPMRTSPVPDAELTKILTYAEAAARQSRRTEINGAIVLAAILGEGRSMAATFLKAQGLTFQAAIKIIQQVLAPTPPPAASRPDPEPATAAPGPAAPSASEPSAEASDPAPAAPTADEAPRERAPLDTYIAPPPRTPPPAEPLTRVPIPEVQRPQREVLGIPSIRPDPPPRPSAPTPAPRPQPPHATEPRDGQPSAPPPAAREPEAKGAAAAPSPPAAPAAASRPSPMPPRPDPSPRGPVAPAPVTPPAPAPPPAPGAGGASRPQAPAAGEPIPPRAQPVPPPATTIRPPPIPGREPVREPGRPAAGPPPIPHPAEDTQPAAGAPSASGLGAPRPAPPRPGMRLPQNPLEGHQITAPWPEPTNDYRPPAPPPVYPPRPPAARAPQHHPDPRAGRDTPPPALRPPPPPPPGRAQAVEKGQLVENIPRRMKVGVAETFEIRIARDGAIEVGQGLPGRTEPQYHAIRITRAMSVRLKGEPGRFYIEASSPETQWTGMQNERLAGDYAVWRFTVIPQLRGPAELMLIVAARSIGTDGVVADTSLPEQRITVRVSANMTRGLKRWVGWISVAVLGGILAKLGEAFWEPALAIIRRVM